MLLIPDQRTNDWHQARKGRITASLAAACLGLDPHKGQLAAYNSIVGKISTNNRHTSWGIEFERDALSAYEDLTGHLFRPTGFWVHDHINWLGASPDGLIGDDGLVEVKCPAIIPANVPLVHRIQALIQLACTGRKWCDYFAWAQNCQPLCKRIWYCPGVNGLIDKLRVFHASYISPGIPPKRRKKHALSKNR